jgi:alkaline phosphatase D
MRLRSTALTGLIWLLQGCDAPKDGHPAHDPGAADTSAGADDTGPPVDTVDTTGGADDTATTDACDADVPDPGAPVMGAVVETITVVARTGTGASDASEDTTIELCLEPSTCVSLDPADTEALATGALGSWTLEGLALPRSAVEGVTLKVADGDDGWVPACLEVRLDGEPVYCEDAPDTRIAAETPEWTDPAGLHTDCNTCWESTLTHGPYVGAVGPDSARVWVRTDATRPVALRVTGPDGASRIADWAYPLPEDDFAAVLDADCLEPTTLYTYEVLVDGVVAATSTFRTAPEAGAPTPFRMAFGSCTKEPDEPIFTTIDAVDPDVFLFVGDNDYANTSDLGSMRWWYRWALERPERKAFLAHTSTLATWDDHDFLGDDSDGEDAGRAAALRAFTEYWANPGFGTADTAGVFYQASWGDVDIFVLDDRYWRGVDGSLLGTDQTAWLEAGLLASTAPFKLLVDGSVWGPSGGDDSWNSFSDERDALFDFVRDNAIGGVVLLSGDIHRSEFAWVRREDDGGYDIPELISSPLANETTACGDDPDVEACYDGGPSFIQVDVDTTAADPVLIADILDETGDRQARLAVWASELE